jgi:hypothetical protein
VTLTADPDHETKASYAFTVVATDGAGNTAEQAVNLAVNNLDEVAPVITSLASASTASRTSLVYEATATDEGDVSAGSVSYSFLEGAGDDADLLLIDDETGVVTLANGLTSAASKALYQFTVVASDGVNQSSKVVSVAVDAEVGVQGPGVLEQGALDINLVNNDDGTVTINLNITDSQRANFSSGISAFQSDLFLDQTLFEAVSFADVVGNSNFPLFTPNVEKVSTGGVITLAGISFASTAPADEVLASISLTPTGDELGRFSVSSINLNTVEPGPTSVVFGDPVAVSGSEASATFVLNGGDATVTLGSGSETLVPTATTGDATTINGFTSGVDTIDLSELLIDSGYAGLGAESSAAAAGLARKYQTVEGLEGLISSDDLSLDNSFGVSKSGNSLTGFYDSDPSVGTVGIESFVLVIESEFALDDLRAAVGGFIA